MPLRAIAIRRAPQTNTGIRVIGTEKTRLYILCGLGKNCSIEGGKASQTRGRLVRREALEAALYTFKFVPSVDTVLAYMPPGPNSTTSQVLFLEKDALKEELKQPIEKTLPLKTPPLPDAEDLAEAATIDKLTLKHIFEYEYQPIETGGALIILNPRRSSAKTSDSGSVLLDEREHTLPCVGRRLGVLLVAAVEEAVRRAVVDDELVLDARG